MRRNDSLQDTWYVACVVYFERCLPLPYTFTDIKEEPEDRVGTVGSGAKSRKTIWMGHTARAVKTRLVYGE